MKAIDLSKLNWKRVWWFLLFPLAVILVLVAGPLYLNWWSEEASEREAARRRVLGETPAYRQGTLVVRNVGDGWIIAVGDGDGIFLPCSCRQEADK